MILFLLRILNQHSGRKACLSRHDPWHLSRDHWMIFLTPIRFGTHIWQISNRFHRQVSRSLTNLFYKIVKIEVILSSKRIQVIIQHYSPIRSLDFFWANIFEQLRIISWARTNSFQGSRLNGSIIEPLNQDVELMKDEHGFTFECACQNKSMSKKYVCEFFKKVDAEVGRYNW